MPWGHQMLCAFKRLRKEPQPQVELGLKSLMTSSDFLDALIATLPPQSELQPGDKVLVRNLSGNDENGKFGVFMKSAQDGQGCIQMWNSARIILCDIKANLIKIQGQQEFNEALDGIADEVFDNPVLPPQSTHQDSGKGRVALPAPVQPSQPQGRSTASASGGIGMPFPKPLIQDEQSTCAVCTTDPYW